MKRFFAAVVAILVAASLLAQNRVTVKGRITDEAGEPLPGAAVIEKGTSNGVLSDLDGRYSITVAAGSSLVFSNMGYREQTEEVGRRGTVDVSLTPDTTFLDEAVVVGYGTMKRSDLTGSVSSVSSKALENFRTGDVATALGGQLAGVSVTSADGTPGGGYQILIRGVGTVNGDASPLYIVDGFEVSNIDYLAQQDIFSIEVLKDASASAIYGARAANGVVLVTTKSGAEGKTQVSYNGSMSYRVLSKRLEVLSAYEYVALQHEQNPGDDYRYFKAGVDDDGVPYKYQTMDDYKAVGYGINWQDVSFRNTWSQNHDISVKGGTKTSSFTASFSHFDENGIYANSGYIKDAGRLKFRRQLTKNVTADANVNFTKQNKYGMGTSGYTLINVLQYRPTGGLKLSDERLLGSAFDPDEDNSYNDRYNPLKAAYTTDASTVTYTWMANGSLTWNIIEGLSFKVSGSWNQSNMRQDSFYHSDSQQALRSGGAYGQSKMQTGLRYTVNNVLTYEKKFGGKGNQSKVIGTLGQEYSYNSTEYLTGQAKEFPIDNLGVNQLSMGNIASLVETSFTDKSRLSYFARGFYSYKSRYMLTGTIRADASSVFSGENRWGFFPSFSAAWTISNEPWMKGWSKKWLDSLKLRLGWGTVGNDRISSYLSSDIYTSVKYGRGNGQVTALVPRQLANPDLRWEGSETINAGIDFSVLKNRFSGTVDLFRKDSRDLLLKQNLAQVTGWDSQWQNIGQIRNEGVEISLNSINVSKKDFSWTTAFNISFIRNTLVSLQDGTEYMYSRSGFDSNNTNNDYIAIVGQPLGNMYGFVFDGIYQYSDFNIAPDLSVTLKPGVVDMSSHAGVTMTPGHVKYVDVKKDGKITPDDRTVIGNGYPDWFGGLTNTVYFKGFDFSFMLQYSYGNDIYNVTRFRTTKSNSKSRNMLKEVADRWTVYHASDNVPSLKGYVTHDIYSRFIEDGSFLRLKNMTLGYTFPDKLVSKARISRLRLYVTGNNIFCLSRYTGYDPEVSSSSNPLMPGLDNSSYPKSTAWIFGAELKF